MENYLDSNKHKIWALYRKSIRYSNERTESDINEKSFLEKVKAVLSHLNFTDTKVASAVVVERLYILEQNGDRRDSLLANNLFLLKDNEGKYFLELK